MSAAPTTGAPHTASPDTGAGLVMGAGTLSGSGAQPEAPTGWSGGTAKSAGRAGPSAWGAKLFPPAQPSRLAPGLVAGGYIIAVPLLSLLALLRQSGVAATKTVWAEDGALFYTQALQFPFWHAVWLQYNGYEQVVPRLLSELARAVPVTGVSATFALSGAAGLALVACSVFHMARGHIPAVPARLVLVAAIVLLPVATGELLDNAVNLPWWFFFGAFWALLWRPPSLAGRALALVICFLAVASDPLAALLLPLGLARLVSLRALKEHAATLGLLAGLAYQGVARIGVKEPPLAPSTPLHGLATDLGVRVGLGLVAGNRGAWWLASHHPAWAETAGAVLLFAVAVLGFTVPRTRALTVVTLPLALVCFVVPVWLRGDSVVMLEQSLVTGSRYSATPILMLISVVLVAAAGSAGPAGVPGRPRAGPGRPPGPSPRHLAAAAPLAQPVGGGQPTKRGRRWPVALVLVALVPAWAADFRDANARSGGPSWPAQVARATAACRASPSPLARVAIDPQTWVAIVPCHLLLAAVTGPGR